MEKIKVSAADKYLEDLFQLPEVKQVEELASLFFGPSQIALLLHKNVEDFKRELVYNFSSPFRKAYLRGKLLAEIKIRYNTRNLATSGDMDALDIVLKAQSEQKQDEQN